MTTAASRFVVCYTTNDGVHAVLRAYMDGDGTVRDNNHVQEIVRMFVRGNEDVVMTSAPGEDDKVLFEMWMFVRDTRRNGSGYFGWDYAQRPGCPQCVAEAGMYIYRQLKHVLRKAGREQGKEVHMGKKCGGGKKCGK